MPFPKALYHGCGPCVIAVKCLAEPKSLDDVLKGEIVEARYLETRGNRRKVAQDVETALKALEQKYPDDSHAFLEGMASCCEFVPLHGATDISRFQNEDHHI